MDKNSKIFESVLLNPNRNEQIVFLYFFPVSFPKCDYSLWHQMRKERKYYRLSECGSVSAAAVLSPCYMLPATHKHICEQVFVLGIVSLQNNCYPGHYLCRDVSEGGEFSPYFPCALRNVSSWHFKLRFYSFMAAVSTYGHQRLTLLLGSHPLLCQMV